MLIFVAIHELAHVLCDEIGHTKKFEDIFHKLLQEAIEKKLYDPSFEPIRNYCEY
jgi:predicted metal-dependent hydrolase